METRNDNHRQNNEAVSYALRRLEVAENALMDARRVLAQLDASAVASLSTPQPPHTANQDMPLLQPGPVAMPLASPDAPAFRPMPPAHDPNQRRGRGWDGPRPAPVPQQSQPAARTTAELTAQATRNRESNLIRAVAIGGGIITFLGVAFLVAIAIQMGWLGPVGRVILAYLVSLVLLGASYRYRNAAPQPALTALMTTSLYTVLITTHAVTAVYKWIPPNLAGMVMLLCYGAVGYYNWRFFAAKGGQGTAQWLALGAAAICLYTPLASEVPDHLTFALIPLLIAGFGMVHKDAILQGIATVTAAVALAAAIFFDGREYPLLIAVIVVVQTWVLLWAGADRTAEGKEGAVAPEDVQGGKRRPSIVAAAPLCLPLVAAVSDRLDVAQWLVLLAAVGAFVMSLTVFRSERVRNAAIGVLPIAAWATRGPAMVRLEFIDSTIFMVWSVGALVVFFALLLAAMRFIEQAWVTAVWAVCAIGITADLGLPVLTLDFGQRAPDSLLAAIVIWVALIAAVGARPLWPTRRDTPTEIIAVLVGLYLSMLATVGVGMHLGWMLGNARGGMLIAHALVSIAWMALAARFLLTRAGRLTNLGALLALIAVLKLVFYDLAALSGIARAVAFLICGLVLLAVSVRRASLKQNENLDNAAPESPVDAGERPVP